MHFKFCREDFPFSISVFTLAYYLNLETGIVRLTEFIFHQTVVIQIINMNRNINSNRNRFSFLTYSYYESCPIFVVLAKFPHKSVKSFDLSVTKKNEIHFLFPYFVSNGILKILGNTSLEIVSQEGEREREDDLV